MRNFLAALQFLTIFPWPRRTERAPEEIGRGAAFFPLVGLMLGALLVAVDALLRPYLPPLLTGVALVALLALLTRGLHLDGLADTFDGLGAGGARERVLAAMDDPHTGAFGVVALVLVISCKVHALATLGPDHWRALLIAPVIARWALPLLGYRATAAKEGFGALMIVHMTGARLLIATTITVMLVVGFAGARGLATMTFVGFLTIASKTYFHRRLGGVSGDVFGAVGELSETVALVAFAVGDR